MATVQSDDDGRYSFTAWRPVRARGSASRCPQIRNLGQSHAAVTEPVPGLRVVPQKVSDFSVLPGHRPERPARRRGRRSPALRRGGLHARPSGPQVLVQRRLPGGPGSGSPRTPRAPRARSASRSRRTPHPRTSSACVAARSTAPRRPASEAQASNRWRLDLDDQFTLRLDPARWATRQDVHAPESNRTCAKADPSMASASGGVLNLNVARDPAYALGSCSWNNPDTGASGTSDYYLNSHIGTEGAYSFRYGVAAARVKFQEPRGMHGAFWLQDSGEAEGTLGAEIDIVEFFGRGFDDGGIAPVRLPPGRRGGRRHPARRRGGAQGRGRQLVGPLPRLQRRVDTRRSTSSGSTARRRCGWTRSSPTARCS